MTYCVTRQHQWPEGRLMVEISVGDFNYTNPDALAFKYRNMGEGQEFENPIDAVDAACKILIQWRKDSRKRIYLGHGATMGFTMPFDTCTQKEARKWAEKVFEKLPKCYCGNILGKEKYQHEYSDDERFCSESCAEKDYAGYELNEEENEE